MSQVILTTADGDACLAKPYRSIELPRGLDLQRDSDFELPPSAPRMASSPIDAVIKSNERPYGMLKIDNNELHDCEPQGIQFPTGFANILADAVAPARAGRCCNPTSRR
jgi:hypothetical protein